MWYNGDIEKGFNGPGIEWWGWTLRINGKHQKRRFSPDKQLDLTNTHDGLNNNCVVENHGAQTFRERFYVGYDQQESAAILQESAASSLSIQKEWHSKWNQVQFQWFIILTDQHCSRSKKGAELQKTPLKLNAGSVAFFPATPGHWWLQVAVWLPCCIPLSPPEEPWCFHTRSPMAC